MKTLLLLPAFVLGMGCCNYAQTTTTPAEQHASPDSLTAIYRQIDAMDIFQLKKARESYIYKCRIEPTAENKKILAYIEERKARLQ